MDANANKKINILLIEDHPPDAEFIRIILDNAPNHPFHTEHVTHLATGLDRLAEGGIDLVLLDLTLPHSRGLDTLYTVQERMPEIPIIVVTGLEDEALATKALEDGARVYLYKRDLEQMVSSFCLLQSLWTSIERNSQ